MNTRSITRFLREYGRAAVGDARAFQRLVILPQIFVFIIYISIGAALHEPLSASIFKLAAIAYLLIVNMVVQSALRHYSVRLLTFHLLALCLLLCLSTALLGQDALIDVFIPMSVIVLLFMAVPLSWSGALGICFFSGCVLAVFWFVSLGVHRLVWQHETRGPLLVCLSYLALLFRALFRSAAPATGMRNLQALSPIAAPPTSATENGNSSDTAFDGALFRDSSLFFMEELRADLSWRLPLVSLMYSAVIGSATFAKISLGSVYGLWATVLIVAQGFCLYRAFRARSVRGLYALSLVLSAIGAAWWCMFVQSGVGTGLAGDVALCLLVLSFGSLPWPLSMSLVFPAFFLLQLLIREPEVSQPLLFALMLWFSTAAALASAAVNNHALVLRATLLFLKRSIEGGLSTMPLVHLLGYQLLDLGDCDHILLLCGDKSAQLIGRAAIAPSTVDPVFSRGLEAKIGTLSIDEGVLQLTDLGGQFLPALADWFGAPPKRLIFLRTRAIIEEREENLVFVLPVRSRLRLIGMERIFRSVVCASTLVRSALAATRSRFLSSDVLLAAQHSVAEREHELGQMVHLVNNIAQDVSIQCEMAAGLLGATEHAEARQRITLVEVLARNLSAGVSDIKLQRELQRLADTDRSDQVEVEILMEELRVYARYREHRRGDIFEIENFVPLGTAVRVVSREFLETGLRLLLRIRAAKLPQGTRTRVEVNSGNDSVVMRISDMGTANSAVEALSDGRALAEEGSEQREAQYYRTVALLAEKSGGHMRAVPPAGEFKSCIEITLPVARSSGSLRIEAGQWALLVDDNAQVTTFYARVAEALSLKYFSAASVSEAETKIQAHGRPRIVITDIQLGTGSGLDLVRSLRKKYGDALPVIVVSGHTADALADEVSAAGATKYLTKPVGRAKLFAEIRALLSTPGTA